MDPFMRNTIIAFLAVFPAACVHSSASNEQFKEIHVADLLRLQAAPKTVHIYDANGDRTRQKEGVIPGAVLLASSGSYDVGTVLPQEKDAPLVFYCHNKM